MPDIPRLTDWPSSGLSLPRNAHLQEPVDALRALAAAEGYDLKRPLRLQLGFRWLGKIVTKGPNGEDDYTDERYWCQRLFIKSEDDPVNNIDTGNETTFEPNVYTVTNLAEAQAGSHNLLVGKPYRIVKVDGWNDDSGQSRWVMDIEIPGVPVKITGNDTGDAQYNGRILGGTTTAAPGSAFTSPAGMTVPGSDDALICNLDESGLTGHRLKTNTFLIGEVVGQTTETPPRSIVFVHGGVGATASPVTLSGSGTTADTSTWGRDSDAVGLVTTDVSRVLWDSTGDVLYAFTRTKTFDARGMLISVSAETRVTVDTPVAC